MEQIEVKITRAGAFKAGVKLLFSTFLAAALHPGNHFGGDFVCVPGITIRYSGFERCFGTAVAINICRIKISAACGNETVCHFTYLRNIDRAVRVFGKPHQPETKLENIFTKIICHNIAPHIVSV